MADKKLQPIIIKRVKKTAHAHHGGAWKIAYADFVTAMMAFFLLMWLLGSTAQGELQGIAAYFNSPLKVAMSGGSGAGNSSSIVPGGGNDLSKVHGQVRRSEADDSANRRSSQAMGRAEESARDARRRGLDETHKLRPQRLQGRQLGQRLHAFGVQRLGAERTAQDDELVVRLGELDRGLRHRHRIR